MFSVAPAALMRVAFGSDSVALLIVVVPLLAPMFTAVAALPKLIVVAVPLTKLKVVAEVVKLPPFSARFPVNVVLPVTPRVPPRVVAPVPTVKVLEAETLVLPFSVTLPVPVEKVVVPD